MHTRASPSSTTINPPTTNLIWMLLLAILVGFLKVLELIEQEGLVFPLLMRERREDEEDRPEHRSELFTHIDDLLPKLHNKQLAALSDLPEDVYNNSEEERCHYLHVDSLVHGKMGSSCAYIRMRARKK